MSTSYDRLPTLEERVRAASLIVVGRVQSVRPLRRARIGDVEEEQAVAHIAADTVLRGTLAARELSVRFVRARGDVPRPDARSLTDGKRVLLLLVPDVGPDAAAGTYTSYLRSTFELTADDSFTMEIEASPARRRRARQTMSAVRDIVKRIAVEETTSARAWERLEPSLAKRPTLVTITELPDTGPGAGPADSQPIASPPRSSTRKATRRRGK
ncbi:MAG TPA: hypothetical protein VFT47_12005 [Vicinamibacterales bacterium]|nr:hypothetical protein [Vicinamibacterales bacterium]